jgi:hypothetical protein
MLNKFLSLAALFACIVIFNGCNKSSSGSANASADQAAREAKEAKEKAEKEARAKESTEKSKAEKDAADKEAADKLAQARNAETATLAKAKEEINKLFDVPKVEAVIGTLPADKMPTAKAKLAEFKSLWNDFMKEDNNAKMREWKDKLVKSYDELKKSAGL